MCPRNGLQTLLVRLCEFGQFHPIERDRLVQDIDVLILSSRAQGVYSEASHILPPDYSDSASSRRDPVVFESLNLLHFIESLSTKLVSLRSEIESSDDHATKSDLYHEVEAVQEAALTMFNNLRKVRFSLETRRFFVLEGFVPTKEVERFRASVRDFLLSSEPVGKKEADQPYVPTLFSNRRGVSLFENVTLMKGFPKYNEIDPTPVTAVVFPLFFGIMFSDLGHGIVLFLFGFVLMRMFRGNYNYWGKTLMVLGSASMAMGFVRGLFFGVEFPSPLHLLGSSFPVVLTGGFSIQAVPVWLEISIVVGTFHLATGYWISFLNRVRSRDYAEAFLSGLHHCPVFFCRAIDSRGDRSRDAGWKHSF